MLNFLRDYRADEEGAVTVDWVVLTTLVAGMSVFSYTVIRDGAQELTAATAAFLEEQNP